MPRTIDEGFRDFLAKLTPLFTESDAAKRHRASIEACLKNNFNIQRFFRTGSFGNGTSISGYSDVDYFASIPNQYLTANSLTTLMKTRNALKKRYPFTNIRVGRPAITVPFGKRVSEWTEIVPADYVAKTRGGHHIYDIPDYSGGWMRSSPDAHNAYVQRVDQKLGGKVRPLIRFVKAWKYYRQVPISSFYLELQVARYASNRKSIEYSRDVQQVFSLLYERGLGRMVDPLGISGYISPCSTKAKLAVSKSKLITALNRALKARLAELKGNIPKAFAFWKLVYGKNFPGYYK